MCRRAALLLAGVSICSGARRKATYSEGDAFSPYDGQALLKVQSCTKEGVKTLEELVTAGGCTDVDEEGVAELGRSGCSSTQVICPQAAANHLLEGYSANVELVQEDAGAHLRATMDDIEPYESKARGVNAADSFYDSFRGLSDQENRVKSAVQNSGGAATLESMGKSIEGRNIWAVRIRGKGYKSGSARVVMSFQVHAREWVAGMSGVYAVEQMVAKAKSDPSYFANTEVMIIPTGNPDGFYYSTRNDRMWRKNRAKKTRYFGCGGVDINRNFPVGWGGPHSTSTRSCSDVYIGPSSASEPESKAIMKMIDENPVSVYIDVHCYGRYILKPWSYTNNPHPRLSEVDDVGKKMLKAMKSHRNNAFRYGGNELLGAASGVCPDYANGGLGFTYELTTAFDPPAREILPSAVECLDGLYAAVDWSKANR